VNLLGLTVTVAAGVEPEGTLEELIPQALDICRKLALVEVNFIYHGGLCVVLNHGTAIFWASGTERDGQSRVWRSGGSWESGVALDSANGAGQ
jgi:hypothetical protein